MIPDAWRQTEVAVVGLGKSGVAASRWLARHAVRVYASDSGDSPSLRRSAETLRRIGVVVEVGHHDLDRIRRSAAVVASPGVAPSAPPLAEARAAGVEIVAELDLGLRALANQRVIAVTGTNGKTTTTALIAHLLSEGAVRSAAVGNIGRPITELLDAGTVPDWLAIEVSSFQLHDAPHLTPAVGVLTNLAPDHLDRYVNVSEYYADKRLLFRNAHAGATWVLNGDDETVLDLARGVEGLHHHFRLEGRGDAWLDPEHDRLMLGDQPLLARGELRLLGRHNVANALAGALAASAAGVERAAIARGLASFRSPPHRLEPVRTVGGVLWINDSKATNVAATTVALAAMDRPFVLILGGRDKGESYDALRERIDDRCVGVVAYGEAAERVAAALEGDVRIVRPFDRAVETAGAMVPAQGAVLLSPACASFDQFANFEERGERFRLLVEAR